VQTITAPGAAPTIEQIRQAEASGLQVVMVRTCGHERDQTSTTRPEALAHVGEDVACWSSCDKVPARNGSGLTQVRRVARYEFRPTA
jgi:hypothetical protein